jgi:hypothetical protein
MRKNMSWKDKVSSTFGIADLIFAGHSSDEEAALELMKECYQLSIPLQDVLDEVERYLKSEGASAQHVKEQLGKVREKFKEWLDW